MSLPHLLECVPECDVRNWRVHLRSEGLDEARLTDERRLRELFFWIGELEVTALVGADLGAHRTVVGNMVLEEFIRYTALIAAVNTLEHHACSPLVEVIVVKLGEHTTANRSLGEDGSVDAVLRWHKCFLSVT